jgi:hypothetical protein
VAVGGNTVAIPIGAHDPRIYSRTILEDDVLLRLKSADASSKLIHVIVIAVQVPLRILHP